MKKVVASRELKNRLGTYLVQVRGGVTIVVTLRGKPVAELRPFPLDDDDEEAGLQRLAATGLVSARKRKTVDASFRPVKLRGRASLSETISEDREDRV
jgi:prevent-host-death family protein